MMEIERCHKEHVATRNPHEYRVLEAASEIWVRRVPCHIGILQCGKLHVSHSIKRQWKMHGHSEASEIEVSVH